MLSVDYLRVLTRTDGAFLKINPLLDPDNNPATPRVRALAADLQRVYGDPTLLGPVSILCSCNNGAVRRGRCAFRAALAADRDPGELHAGVGAGDGRVDRFHDAGRPRRTRELRHAGRRHQRRYEWGPTSVDERHRITVAGVVPLPWGIDVAPSFTAARARPYTQYQRANPNGAGILYLRDANGQPLGPNNARGKALINANARVTKQIPFAGSRRLSLFAEFYNMLNRANFGNSYGGNAFAPATYNQPNGYLGGIGSTTTLPISFQVQFGGRYLVLRIGPGGRPRGKRGRRRVSRASPHHTRSHHVSWVGHGLQAVPRGPV